MSKKSQGKSPKKLRIVLLIALLIFSGGFGSKSQSRSFGSRFEEVRYNLSNRFNDVMGYKTCSPRNTKAQYAKSYSYDRSGLSNDSVYGNRSEHQVTTMPFQNKRMVSSSYFSQDSSDISKLFLLGVKLGSTKEAIKSRNKRVIVEKFLEPTLEILYEIQPSESLGLDLAKLEQMRSDLEMLKDQIREESDDSLGEPLDFVHGYMSNSKRWEYALKIENQGIKPLFNELSSMRGYEIAKLTK